MTKLQTLRDEVATLTDPKLIEMLDRTFPPKVARPGMHMDEILYHAGCRRVIDWLRECRQQADSLG